MEYNKKYNPWLIAKSGDSADRPVLGYCRIIRINKNETDNGVIISADGFRLSMIPCTLFPKDIVGLVYWKALQGAEKVTPKKWDKVIVYLEKDNVRFLGGSINRYINEDHAKFTFPNYLTLLQNIKVGNFKFIPVNPEYIGETYKILGNEYIYIINHVSSHKCHMVFMAPITNALKNNGGLFPLRPPFVILMQVKPPETISTELPENGFIFGDFNGPDYIREIGE